jgi:DNA segregation ATPase FtsK/SpoIIIE, S-DNA-T family
VLLIIDELADVIAYQPDHGLRKRANAALQLILSQGRAPGGVIGQIQDPRKEIIDFQPLFSVKIAMRLDEPTQGDMVLDDGVASAERPRTRSVRTPRRGLDQARRPLRPRSGSRLPHHRYGPGTAIRLPPPPAGTTPLACSPESRQWHGHPACPAGLHPGPS